MTSTDNAVEEVTITIRLLRSFQHRTVKNLILKNVDLNKTVGELKKEIVGRLPNETSVPPPFRKHAYDTLKIEHQAHGAKTNDPLINKEADESLILADDQATLSQAGVKNETTITFFKYDDYLQYKDNPTLVW